MDDKLSRFQCEVDKNADMVRAFISFCARKNFEVVALAFQMHMVITVLSR